MLQQLILIELLLKGGAALVLLVAPGPASRLLGLPVDSSGFWPRLLGSMLLAIAVALLFQSYYTAFKGIAPAGLITINLSTATTLGAMIVLKRVPGKRRGNIFLWAIAATLVLLSLFELSVI